MCVSPGPVKLKHSVLKYMIALCSIKVFRPGRAGNELSSTVGVVNVADMPRSSIVLNTIGNVQSCVQTWESLPTPDTFNGRVRSC